ncbi:hypothetical protein GOODEAATRI_012793 [Goodea atripinnis]|uniref:Uncharacterized protein n=1 Tax=Goodea atripinnis TaxID=208336 RepID=A0ABV0PN60_9TELE
MPGVELEECVFGPRLLKRRSPGEVEGKGVGVKKVMEGHVVGVRLMSWPVTLGKSWNLITASQTLSRTDLLTLVASRHALPPLCKCPCTGWPLCGSNATFSTSGEIAELMLSNC